MLLTTIHQSSDCEFHENYFDAFNAQTLDWTDSGPRTKMNVEDLNPKFSKDQ